MRKLIWAVLALPLAACVTDGLSWPSLPKTEVTAAVEPVEAPTEVAEATPPPAPKTKSAKKPKPTGQSAEKASKTGQ